MAKLSKFEIELPAAPKSSKLSLSERDIAMATMYVSHASSFLGRWDSLGILGEDKTITMVALVSCFSSAIALQLLPRTKHLNNPLGARWGGEGNGEVLHEIVLDYHRSFESISFHYFFLVLF